MKDLPVVDGIIIYHVAGSVTGNMHLVSGEVYDALAEVEVAVRAMRTAMAAARWWERNTPGGWEAVCDALDALDEAREAT